MRLLNDNLNKLCKWTWRVKWRGYGEIKTFQAVESILFCVGRIFFFVASSSFYISREMWHYKEISILSSFACSNTLLFLFPSFLFYLLSYLLFLILINKLTSIDVRAIMCNNEKYQANFFFLFWGRRSSSTQQIGRNINWFLINFFYFYQYIFHSLRFLCWIKRQKTNCKFNIYKKIVFFFFWKCNLQQ